jgi:hypothetical protein
VNRAELAGKKNEGGRIVGGLHGNHLSSRHPEGRPLSLVPTEASNNPADCADHAIGC